MSKELVERYLTNDEVIKTMEADQRHIKDVLWEELHAGQALPDSTWEYDGVGQVCLVKGRKGSSKLNRSKLVLQGVTKDTLDACTDVGEPGKPHLRIERPKG